MNSNKRNVGESRIRGILGEVKNEFSGYVDPYDDVALELRNYEGESKEIEIKRVEEELERKNKK